MKNKVCHASLLKVKYATKLIKQAAPGANLCTKNAQVAALVVLRPVNVMPGSKYNGFLLVSPISKNKTSTDELK